jgi:GTP-binding protein HflX
LIAAFRATLQEAREADLLLHVIDASDPYHSERQAEVEAVLEAIGASAIPVIRVLNKIDRVDQAVQSHAYENGQIHTVAISALSGDGIDLLKQAIANRLRHDRFVHWIELQGKDARLRAQLFELGAVNEERISDSGAWLLHVDLPLETAQRLARLPDQSGAIIERQLLAQASEQFPTPTQSQA